MRDSTKTPLGKPSCGNCTACCYGLVVLHEDEGDVLSDYKVVYVTQPETGQIAPALPQKPNGMCAYLIEGKCSIYDKRPSACKRFDCRLAFWMVDTQSNWKRRHKRQLPPSIRNTLREGRLRHHTLEATPAERLTYKNHVSFVVLTPKD